ncbi:MAG: glycosyltransferase family 4 protein [Myxococcota bacterium]|nr:glycosyltransferase family 4 protein [Myxococcota bacterium]
MRLAVEVTTCTPARTGIGYYTEHLVDALLWTRGPDDEVVLLSNRHPAPELASRWAPHLDVRGIGARALWMQSTVPRMLTASRADVGVYPNYVAPLASPCPSVVIVHDLAVLRAPQHFTAPKRLLMHAVLRPSVASASVVAAVSHATQRDILDLLGVDPERVALLPAAAHPSCSPAHADVVRAVRARHGLPRPYVLTVGTIEPRKNLVTLLRAFDALGSSLPDHELVVVGGRGWLEQGIVRELNGRGTSRRVRWLGYVTEPDLVALYTGADLFVLASTLEGFGLPVLEAMACGTPVIASDVAALREVGGEAARYVPATDSSAFARAIAEALADRDGLAVAKSAGEARAKEYSWNRTAETLWERVRRIAPARVATSFLSTKTPPTLRSAPANGAATLAAPLHPIPAALGRREWALLATVVYADMFDSPLPLQEAASASLGVVLDDAEVRRLAVGPALSRLVVLHPRGYLVLTGREDLADAMPDREALTRSVIDRSRATLRLLSRLPYVRALVTSGGVAHRNPGKRPDFDLFVIAARGRAYTAYTFLFVATKLTGTRALICPNYLVDESELAIAYHRDLFTAHQLLSCRPFSGRHAYERLCESNEDWVRTFFPGFASRSPAELATSSALGSAAQRFGELALRPSADALERLLRVAWRLRLRSRAAGAIRGDVVLGDGILKLHVSDYRRRVLARFAARLQSLRADLETNAGAVHSGGEQVVP